jgi:hypothetical protein
LGEGHHRAVCHFDAAKPVPLAQFDTFAEPVVRTDYPTANVFGVAETAKCHGFKLGRSGTSRQFQCKPLFLHAALDVTARKT